MQRKDLYKMLKQAPAHEEAHRDAYDYSRVDRTRTGEWEPTQYERLNYLVTRSGANIILDNTKHAPMYDIPTDAIKMPEAAAFDSPEDYARTVLHELSHWTGPRTGRFTRAGLDDYDLEELTAEASAVILQNALGLEDGVNDFSAGYMAGYANWEKLFFLGMVLDRRPRSRDSTRLLLGRAIHDAEKAADYLLAKLGDLP